jgi:predicted alpha-1,6-mannanase (GH76 family)
MNRLGEGEIDKHWKFTYCQGVYMGAGLELYRITHNQTYLQHAVRTAHAAIAELADPGSTLLPPEGKGDGGLFKGIFVRYLNALLLELRGSRDVAEWTEFAELLIRNASALWNQGRRDELPLFGNQWDQPADGKVDLSTQLSGVMLIEMLAAIEKEEPDLCNDPA